MGAGTKEYAGEIKEEGNGTDDMVHPGVLFPVSLEESLKEDVGKGWVRLDRSQTEATKRRKSQKVVGAEARPFRGTQ